MSHFVDYMDDVPVKISEKFKRPPCIDLPYVASECPAQAKRAIETARYCTVFERNVISKITELRSAKEIKKSERRHRLQLLEEAKQKKLDAIAAAEAEEKWKQLSVSEVSYPSTDEISAISPDEKVEKNCDTSPTQDNSPEADVAVDVNYTRPATSTESQPKILQPVQVQSNIQQNNLLDDPDPLLQLKLNSRVARVPQYNRNVDTLTFKDFENDTSSPFDNVELKTINDMEQLAQVLQSQRDSVASCQPQQSYEHTYPGYVNCASQAQTEGVAYLPNAYLDQPIAAPGIIYATPSHYPITNGYCIPEHVCDNAMPLENVYMPNYHYFVPAHPFPVTDPYYNPLPTTSREVPQVPNGSSYIPQPYYFHYPHVPMSYETPSYNPAVMETKNAEDQNQNPQPSTQNTVKSRSRSVTDIIEELNEELAAVQLQNLDRSTSTGHNARSGPSNERRIEKACWKQVERLPNPMQSLSPLQQRMCQNIHNMGFPLDRVARMFSLIGHNDRRVIECLLTLGELMDIGFTEGKATEALTKHDFDKDKALDDLIS